MNPFQHIVTVGHNTRVIVYNRRPIEREDTVEERSEGDMERDALKWSRAGSNPPRGYPRQLWRSASTPTEPFHPDRNTFCWCPWYMEVNILQSIVGYLNATMNRETWNAEPDIGTDGCSQTQQNPWVDSYRSWFGPPRLSGSGFWTGPEPKRPVFEGQTRIAGGLPGPIANSINRYIDT